MYHIITYFPVLNKIIFVYLVYACNMNSCSDVWVFSLRSTKKMETDVVISTTAPSEHYNTCSLSLTQLLNQSLMHSHSLFLPPSLFLLLIPPSCVSLNKPQSRAAAVVGEKCWNVGPGFRTYSLVASLLPPSVLHHRAVFPANTESQLWAVFPADLV